MNLIKEYLKVSIEAKKTLKKEIERIDKVVQTLAIAQAEQNILLEEFKKQSFKEKYREEHKKSKRIRKTIKGDEKIMRYEIDEEFYNKISNITDVDYEYKYGTIDYTSIEPMLSDLLCAYDSLKEEFEDFKRYIDNKDENEYDPYDMYREYN